MPGDRSAGVSFFFKQWRVEVITCGMRRGRVGKLRMFAGWALCCGSWTGWVLVAHLSVRIPLLQMTGTAELPRLRGFSRIIRRDQRRIQAAALFTTLQPGPEDAVGKMMAPMDWRLTGPGPEIVRKLAQSL